MVSRNELRERRAWELRAIAGRPGGRDEIFGLFYACFPRGTLPPVGLRVIETILDHEFGSATAEKGGAC